MKYLNHSKRVDHVSRISIPSSREKLHRSHCRVALYLTTRIALPLYSKRLISSTLGESSLFCRKIIFITDTSVLQVLLVRQTLSEFKFFRSCRHSEASGASTAADPPRIQVLQFVRTLLGNKFFCLAQILSLFKFFWTFRFFWTTSYLVPAQTLSWFECFHKCRPSCDSKSFLLHRRSTDTSSFNRIRPCDGLSDSFHPDTQRGQLLPVVQKFEHVKCFMGYKHSGSESASSDTNILAIKVLRETQMFRGAKCFERLKCFSEPSASDSSDSHINQVLTDSDAHSSWTSLYLHTLKQSGSSLLQILKAYSSLVVADAPLISGFFLL